MRALVLNGDKFAVEERPMPEPDVGEVLFRTHYSGICGTDLHAPDLNFYTPGVVIGHEFAGEVAAVGLALKNGKLATGRPSILGATSAAHATSVGMAGQIFAAQTNSAPRLAVCETAAWLRM